jgi:hypothetical protein
LHVHTSLSDSTFSPKEVIQYARRANLSAIAITDHDCVGGISPAIDFASHYDIEIVPGVELTAELEASEVHILGFYIDWKDEWFVGELKEICQQRIERIHKMLERLREIGVNIMAEEVFKLSGGGSIGRMHLARVLKNRGYVSSIEEAFKRFIGEGECCYVKRLRPTSKEAIEMINKVGGIAVLAHPHTLHQDNLIPQLVKDGIRGIEVYYPEQSEFTREIYEDLAHKYNLVITGGSDCHGLGKDEVFMGKVKIPYELVEKLKSSLK